MESSASAGRVASAVLDPRRWWALALLCGAFFMVLLDGTITILALTEGYRSAFLACAVLAGIGLALALERDRLLLEARRARRARRQRLVPAAPARRRTEMGKIVVSENVTLDGVIQDRPVTKASGPAAGSA